MKNLIVILMMFLITAGIGCKKEKVQPEPEIMIFRVEFKEMQGLVNGIPIAGTHAFVTTILDTQDYEYEETGIYWNYGESPSEGQKVTENTFENPYVGEQYVNPYWIGRGVYRFPVDPDFTTLSVVAFATGEFGTIYSDVEIINR